MNPKDSKQLTLFPAGSHNLASRSPLPAEEPGRMTTDSYGPKCLESFAKLNPDGSWLKTYQDYYQSMMDGSLEKFLGTFPKSGMVSNGIAYRLGFLERRNEDGDSGLLPTPKARDYKDISSTGEVYASSIERHEPSLATESYLAGFRLESLVSIYEWVMGVPPRWTDLEYLETAKTLALRNGLVDE